MLKQRFHSWIKKVESTQPNIIIRISKHNISRLNENLQSNIERLATQLKLWLIKDLYDRSSFKLSLLNISLNRSHLLGTG